MEHTAVPQRLRFTPVLRPSSADSPQRPGATVNPHRIGQPWPNVLRTED